MPNVYRQHDASFASVSAYVIAKNGERVATIAFKFPRDGAGRLLAYVHWLGLEMVRGYAAGGGYDKRSAACAHAADKMAAKPMSDEDATKYAFDVAGYDAFRQALAKDDGFGWDRRLRDAGFEIWQAV